MASRYGGSLGEFRNGLGRGEREKVILKELVL